MSSLSDERRLPVNPVNPRQATGSQCYAFIVDQMVKLLTLIQRNDVNHKTFWNPLTMIYLLELFTYFILLTYCWFLYTAHMC